LWNKIGFCSTTVSRNNVLGKIPESLYRPPPDLSKAA